MAIGTYPTPVQHLVSLSRPRCELWVKRDDQTHPIYGGNKVRKLDHILEDARRQGARRIVTIGAVGSHHVLATVVHGLAAGFRVAAVLTPQPFSQHAQDNLRAGLAAGLEAHPARSFQAVPLVLARLLSRHDYFVPPGGSTALGSVGYAEAVTELSAQVSEGLLPQPDLIVAALGSGGTVAGLLAGVAMQSMPCRILAVRVVPSPLVTGVGTLLLARAVAQRLGHHVRLRTLRAHLEVDDDFLGEGYAYPTTWGQRAMEAAKEQGLALEATYTAKAFAGAMRQVEHATARRVLYWHTLSGARMEPLLSGAPELPEAWQRMFLRAR